MKHRHSSGRKQLVFVVLAIVLLLLVGVFALKVGSNAYQARNENTAEGSVLTMDGVSYREKNYLNTYLIMGIDKAEASENIENVNDQQSDFNALVVADLKNESYSILYLNRDIMTDIPVLALDGTPYTTRYQQLALAHTYGSGMEDSCENMVNTVSSLLGGIVIDHYAAFYLESIGVLNDAVGGVTVTIEDDFSAADSTMGMGETITLNATQAEHFVRSRIDVADGTNLNRMKRQMTYLLAWTELASNKLEQDSSFASTLASQLGDQIVTDLSVQQISDLAEVFNTYEQTGAYQLEGEAVRGETYMEYYLDDDALQKMILKLFYDEVKS